MKSVKRMFSILLSMIMAISFSTITTINAYAEENPILYLEVSNTLTAQDTFAWDEYDHYNYSDRWLPTLPKHIIYDGDNIKMIGYSVEPFKDFLFVEDDNSSKKILSSDLQRDSSSWHTVESGGFLFNASIENGILRGFAVLVTGRGMQLVELTGVDVDSFTNGNYETVASTGKILATYSMNFPYKKHHVKIEASKSEVSVWDDGTLVIEKFALPENDYGFGYGPITSYYSHSCSQQSSFTFSNIKMETVTGYYIRLEKTKDIWGLTDEYWKDTFTLTSVEYIPDEKETIANFSEYPLFKNAEDMILFYPDGTYEHIPWSNGKADYINAERYINVLEQNTDVGLVELKPGQRIIGAYAE
ncbi:MAG: hypothetical protein J6A37_10495 [Oscillospiraceae bacterium]|nr:hypothetical protein [Oscillospiraceae bacterium]